MKNKSSKIERAIKKQQKLGRLKRSSRNGKQLFTMLDMSIVKHDEAVHNSRVKRGEIEKGSKHMIYQCGCGSPGCCLHIEVQKPQLEK